MLHKKGWIKYLSRQPHTINFPMSKLINFEISVPKMVLWGKLEWKTSDGTKGSFLFSTDSEMVKKIEKYMQHKLDKNQQKIIDIRKLRSETELADQTISIAA